MQKSGKDRFLFTPGHPLWQNKLLENLEESRHISCALSASSLAIAIVDIFISVFHESINIIYDHDKFDVAFYWISAKFAQNKILKSDALLLYFVANSMTMITF